MRLSENTFEVPVSSLDPSDMVVLSQAGPLRGGTPVTVTVTAVISSSPAGHLQRPRLLLGWQLSPTVLYKLLPMLRPTGRSGSGDRQARPSAWGLIRLPAGEPGTEPPRRRGEAQPPPTKRAPATSPASAGSSGVGRKHVDILPDELLSCLLFSLS